MRLPVSRLAYDAALADVAWLRGQVEARDAQILALIQHTARMDRIDRGLRETPPPEPKAPEPPPDWARRYIDSWSDGPIRDTEAAALYAAYAELGDWELVRRRAGVNENGVVAE